MYRHKYHKYKNKYLRLRENTYLVTDSDVEPDDDHIKYDIATTPEDPNPPYYPAESTKEDTEVWDTVLLTTPEAPTIIKDIGKSIIDKSELNTYMTRGKILKPFEVSGSEYTSVNKPNNNKILKINTVDEFDDFTDRYGYVYKFIDSSPVYGVQELLLIRWTDVAGDYKGLYINEGLQNERFTEVFFRGRTYPSWWNTEFKITDILIFDKDNFELATFDVIKSPFSARVYDENELREKNFIDIYDKSKDKKQKILKLDDIKSFDKFTNEFGYLYTNRKNKQSIKIDWSKVSSKYKGIYIDKDSDIYEDRIKFAFFNDIKLTSWLHNTELQRGKIYVFQLETGEIE